jgi:hypothetical protein
MTNAVPAAAQAAPAADDASGWRAFARRGLRNQLLCLLIALVIWLLGPSHQRFVNCAIYSFAIGNLCWLFIDGSRILLSRWIVRRGGSAGKHGRWPGVGGMLVCILGGTALGYSLGSAIGDAITGFHTPSLFDNLAAMVLSAIIGVGATYFYYTSERLHHEQAAAEAARRAAAESQLKLLESQLEPHMLFNTLANLRVLIGVDPTRAQAMLDHLIAFLRATLSASRSGSHPLATEFDRLADYLALMAVRMGPRLQVAFELPDALRALPVPPLLLQPLVENSIKHGLEPKVEGGRITVSARSDGQRLLLQVRDTGIGLSAATASAATAGTPVAGGGFGSTQVRERLAALYGDAARFSLQAADDGAGGAVARIEMPLSLPPPA